MYNCLIFEGGGVLGISYIGAIRAIDEFKILENIKKFAGSSAGAQAATLLALGYTINEFYDIFSNIPLHKFKDGSCGCFRNIYHLFNKYGYYRGNFIYNYFDYLIEKKLKKNATFLDLFNYNKNHLSITGTCLEKQALEIFDYKNTPNMPIAQAIRISCSVPFIYKPVFYNNKTYVDGGCIRNLPKNIFDFDNELDECLVFNLISDFDRKIIKINNIKDYTMSLVKTIYLSANTVDVLHDKITTVNIEIKNIDSFNFYLDESEKINLINLGYNATLNKLKI